MHDVSRILSRIEQGDSGAADKLLPLVYDELRRLATNKMARESAGQTLNATALVHDAYLRLVGPDGGPHWDNRGHFFAAAAEAMRRILVENARRKSRVKHGGDRSRVPLEANHAISSADPHLVLAISDALERLEHDEPIGAQIAKLRYFTGLSVEEAGKCAKSFSSRSLPPLEICPCLASMRTGGQSARIWKILRRIHSRRRINLMTASSGAQRDSGNTGIET